MFYFFVGIHLYTYIYLPVPERNVLLHAPRHEYKRSSGLINATEGRSVLYISFGKILEYFGHGSVQSQTEYFLSRPSLPEMYKLY